MVFFVLTQPGHNEVVLVTVPYMYSEKVLIIIFWNIDSNALFPLLGLQLLSITV